MFSIIQDDIPRNPWDQYKEKDICSCHIWAQLTLGHICLFCSTCQMNYISLELTLKYQLNEQSKRYKPTCIAFTSNIEAPLPIGWEHVEPLVQESVSVIG